MQLYFSALNLALAACGMGWGIYLSLKVFNFPDITTDGSFTLGGTLTAVLLVNGFGWLPAVLLGLAGGMLAGMCTGLIHTGLKVNPLLSGILVMTALYSVNLLIMGRSNIPLQRVDTLFSDRGDEYTRQMLLLGLIVGGLALFIVWLLRTDFGIAVRATGNSEGMARAYGVNVPAMKITGLAIANGLTALSGSLTVQLLQFADINMGVGIVISGLGAVMIGETLMDVLRRKGIGWRIAGVVAGCILFRLMFALTLQLGADPAWQRLINALVVILFLALPRFRRLIRLK